MIMDNHKLIRTIKAAFLFLTLFTTQISYAGYYNNGEIYTGSSFPVSISPITYTNDKVKAPAGLKTGTSKSMNIFCLVEVGDASIDAAAKNGGINKIYYVDSKINKVYIPLLFLPIYVKQVTTVVYGEEKDEEEFCDSSAI